MRRLLSGMLGLGLVACAGGSTRENTAPVVAAAPVADRTLFGGTRIAATIRDSLSSRNSKTGETLAAIVSDDVVDANGQVVIPSGSVVDLMIGQLEPATNAGQADGKITLRVISVNVRGMVYPVNADLDSVPHQLQGRGVTAGEVEKVGIGAAAGAVVGRVLGKNTKGAIIGGVIGAGAGTVVAARTASRDVVVTPGTPIVFWLTQSLKIATK